MKWAEHVDGSEGKRHSYSFLAREVAGSSGCPTRTTESLDR
jgi:hypothetical protein